MGKWALCCLKHGTAKGVGTGAGKEEISGVADLLERDREIAVLPGFFIEVHVNPQLQVCHGVGIRYDPLEFLDKTLGKM